MILESEEVAKSRALVEARVERLVDVRQDVVAIRAGKLVGELYVTYRQTLYESLDDISSQTVEGSEIPKMVEESLAPAREWFNKQIEEVPVETQEHLTKTWNSNEEVMSKWIEDFVDVKEKEISNAIDGYMKTVQSQITLATKRLPPDQQEIRKKELQDTLDEEKRKVMADDRDLLSEWKKPSTWPLKKLLEPWKEWWKGEWETELTKLRSDLEGACRNQMKMIADQGRQKIKPEFLPDSETGLNDLYKKLIEKTTEFREKEREERKDILLLGEDARKWREKCLEVVQLQECCRKDLATFIEEEEKVLEKEREKLETKLKGILDAEKTNQKGYLAREVELYIAQDWSKWMMPSLEAVQRILEMEMEKELADKLDEWKKILTSVCPPQTGRLASTPQKSQTKALNDEHTDLANKRKELLVEWKKHLEDALTKIMDTGEKAWKEGMTTFLDVQPQVWKRITFPSNESEKSSTPASNESEKSSTQSPESRFRELAGLYVDEGTGKLAGWVEPLVGKGPTRMTELVRNGLLPKGLLKTSLTDLEVLQDIFDDGSATLKRPMEVPPVTAMTGPGFLPDVTTRASIAALPVMINGGLYYQLSILRKQVSSMFCEIASEIAVLQSRLERLNQKVGALLCEVDEPQLILVSEPLSGGATKGQAGEPQTEAAELKGQKGEPKTQTDETTDKAREWVVDLLRKRNTRLRCIQSLDELMSRYQQIYRQLASEPEFKNLAMAFSRFVFDTSESDGRMNLTYERKVRFEIAGRWRLETRNEKKETKSSKSTPSDTNQRSAENLRTCFQAVRKLEEKICKKRCMERSQIIDHCLAIVDQLKNLPDE